MITAKESKKLFKEKLKQNFKNEKEKIIKLLETEVDTLIRESISKGYCCAYLEFAENPIDGRITPTAKNAKFIKKYLKEHGYKVHIYFKCDDDLTAELIRISW